VPFAQSEAGAVPVSVEPEKAGVSDTIAGVVVLLVIVYLWVLA
jgi:hypothetical protein